MRLYLRGAQQVKADRLLARVAIYGAFVALGFALAFVFALPKSDKAPEFYGAFAAAIIAGATLILGTFYQETLKQEREQKREQKIRTTEAIDLCFWLQHCDGELEFIETALTRIRDRLANEKKMETSLSVDTFREIITSHFYGELLDRARSAARLPPEMAGLIADDLYKTFTTVDRVFLLRQAPEEYRLTFASIEKYIFLVSKRREKLQSDAELLESYLIGAGALPRLPKINQSYP
jgi:hypothetical protein